MSLHEYLCTMFIFRNRRVIDGLTADVIIGPIANDTIFDTFGIISSGFLKTKDAMKLLMVGPEYTQVAIKSKKAADRLRWFIAGTALSYRKEKRDSYSPFY